MFGDDGIFLRIDATLVEGTEKAASIQGVTVQC